MSLASQILQEIRAALAPAQWYPVCLLLCTKDLSIHAPMWLSHWPENRLALACVLCPTRVPQGSRYLLKIVGTQVPAQFCPVGSAETDAGWLAFQKLLPPTHAHQIVLCQLKLLILQSAGNVDKWPRNYNLSSRLQQGDRASGWLGGHHQGVFACFQDV